MIQELCNLGHEHHIDTFYKVAIFEASQLPYFTYLSSDTKIQDILTNIPDSSQVLITDLLLNNIKVGHGSTASASGKLYSTTISFMLTPQDKNIQSLLETYNNEEVIILVSKRITSHLYGTAAQPMIFKYAEANSPDPSAVKGYAISLSGKNYGASKLFEEIEFNIYSRGLAFELAQEI